MPDSAKKARPPKAILKEARTLLSSLNLDESDHRPASSFEKESAKKRQSGDTGRNLLLRCVGLVEEFERLSSMEFQLEFKDWTVVKAVVELLVRWGIYPYLRPGVGIPLQKMFGEKAVAAAAAALSDNLLNDPGGSEASPAVTLDSIDGVSEPHPLILSAELLSSLLLQGPASKDDGISPGMTEDRSNTEIKKEEKVHALRSPEEAEEVEEIDPGFSSPALALHQLVLSHHLVDVLAALLQAAYGASLTSTSLQALGTWKGGAAEKIQLLVGRLPSAHLVEALFILLGEAEALKPPVWLKPEVGKLLSLVVMRDGGVAAVMERLVGSAEKGSVKVYERVAVQLARVPRSVASKEQYYRGVCSQLQPLLVLPQSHSKFGSSGDVGSRLVSNMHHTSILLACQLAHQDPVLVERYLTREIVEPLLRWDATGSQTEVLEKGNTVVSERSVLDSLLKIQVLITAGHRGSVRLRLQLLQHTSPVAPRLMLLNYLLWPSNAKHDGQDPGEKLQGLAKGAVKDQIGANEGRRKEEHGGPQKDFAKGFLINKSLSASSDGEELGGPVGQLVGAVTDIVHAYLSQTTKQALPIVTAFLFSLDTSMLDWPTADGEIADALKAGREQPESSVLFLAKLLLCSESWGLALALLNVILNNVLKLRRTSLRRSQVLGLSQSDAGVVTPETVLQSLETLDTLYAEVGLKAVEQDASGALPLLKALLDDTELLGDMEMLDLVLQLSHNAISQLQRRDLHEEEEKTQGSMENHEGSLLKSIGLSLDSLVQSAEVSPKQKQFAGAMRSMICNILQSN